MSLSRTEAASALADIEHATGVSQTLRTYRISGPILILWGMIWAAGFAAMGLLPGKDWGLIWLPLDAVGIAGSTIIASRLRRSTGAGRQWRGVAAACAFVVFLLTTYVVFQPAEPAMYMAFPGLVCALAYGVFGLIGPAMRFTWIGAGMFVATLVGFYAFQPWFAWWMAGVGGGGLVLGGLWLRSL